MENKTRQNRDLLFLKNCTQCKQIFLNKDEYQQHMGVGNLQCKPHQNNNQVYERDKQEKTHTLRGKKKHPCNVCGKTFSKNCHLKLHMMVHTGELPHKCSLCDKAFSQRCNLENHMCMHTGERPYKCTECGIAFTRNKGLADHMMIHTGEKPHECSQCDKSFSRSSHLKRHMMIHTGAKPYECSHCKLTFIQNNHLLRHVKLAHNGQKDDDLQIHISNGKVFVSPAHKTKSKLQSEISSEHTKKSNKQNKSKIESHYMGTKNDKFSSDEILRKIEKDIEKRKSQNRIIYKKCTCQDCT